MIVIDTHVLVWWANGTLNKLSKAAKTWLSKAEKKDGGILVSAISAWEIAVSVGKGRLTLAMDVEDWLGHAAALPGDGTRARDDDPLQAVAGRPGGPADRPADAGRAARSGP